MSQRETHFSRNGALFSARVPLYFQERLRKAKEQEEVIHARAIVTRHWERSTGIEHENPRLGFLARRAVFSLLLLRRRRLLRLFLRLYLLSHSLGRPRVRRALLSPRRNAPVDTRLTRRIVRARDYNFILPRQLRIPAPRQVSLSHRCPTAHLRGTRLERDLLLLF